VSYRERAHREALRTEVPAIAERLQEMLGQRLTAFAVGVKDPRAIGRYARGEQAPRDETVLRLRGLFEITQVLLVRETSATVRAWLLGAHPLLEDRAPIELLHEDDAPPVERTASTDMGIAFDSSGRQGYLSVVSAAEEFVRAV
jgi:hypothetical protein